jgi:ABC-type amino acid transport substrate-binding protein
VIADKKGTITIMKQWKKLLSLTLSILMFAGLMSSCASKTATSDTSTAAQSTSTGSDSGKAGLKILDTPYVSEDYAICVAKDNEDLLSKINSALDTLTKDGTVQNIIDKYISGKDYTYTPKNTGDNLPVLTMGTNAEFPPYEYYEGDAVVGIDAEIAAAIADQLGMKLKIEDMEFDGIIAAVQSGKIDMGMAGMTVTDERKQSVNFSNSYATGVQVIIVREGSAITSADDLAKEGNNYTIGVQTGTTGDIYATSDFGDKGLATIEEYNKGADAVQALISGKIDCVIIDNEPAKAFVAANNG